MIPTVNVHHDFLDYLAAISGALGGVAVASAAFAAWEDNRARAQTVRL